MLDFLEVQHIAGLARIDFSKKELEELQKQLSSILDYFDKLKEVDIKKVKPISRSIQDGGTMRSDRAEKQNQKMIKKILELAPQIKGRFIKVKSVFKTSPQ